MTGEEEGIEEISADPFIIEVCKDLLGAGFEIWGLVSHDPAKQLLDTEKQRLSRPLARIAVKYGFAKITKDEVLFGIFLSAAIIKRLPKKEKKEKKDVDDSRGKEGIRKDNVDTKPDSQQ